MSDKAYPTYQYSVFTGAKGQVVVRTDDPVEFKKLVQEVDFTFGGEQLAKPTPAATVPASMCPIHQVVWEREGISKAGKPYAVHKLADGSPCWRK